MKIYTIVIILLKLAFFKINLASFVGRTGFDYWVNPACGANECNGLILKNENSNIGECLMDFPRNSGNFWCYVNADSVCPKFPSPRCDGCFYSYVPCRVALNIEKEYDEYGTKLDELIV